MTDVMLARAHGGPLLEDVEQLPVRGAEHREEVVLESLVRMNGLPAQGEAT